MNPRRRSGTLLVWAAAVLAALVLWAGIDLYGPARTDLRVFDPEDVARLDADMWRSYYERKPLPLFLQLAELMRRQFHMPFLRSHVAAYRAARAAFRFKRGHGRADYERALPDLHRYYGAIREMSTTPFDVHRTSVLELEWWIVHRERGVRDPDSLARTLALAAGELYRVSPDSLMDYGRLRANAMTVRDTSQAKGGVTEGDWRRIRALLEDSWRSLWKAVQTRRA